MSECSEDAQAELLRLYRDNFDLRQDKQLAAEQEQERLRKENDALRNEKSVLKAQLEESNAQNGSLKTTILDLENAAEEHAGMISESEKALEVMKIENMKYKSKNNELDRLLHELQAKVAELEKQVPERPHSGEPLPSEREEPHEMWLPTEEGEDPPTGGQARTSRRRLMKHQLSEDSDDDGQTETAQGEQSLATPEADRDPEASLAAGTRKRRRVDSHQSTDDCDSSPETHEPVTAADLAAAFPEQFAALARAEKHKGFRKAYCVFEVACALLRQLDMDKTPGKGLLARVVRRLPGAAREVRMSAWDVLEASGCYASPATYRNWHSRFGRMARWHEYFFAHARGAQRMSFVRDARAREILLDVEDFVAGRPTQGSTDDWERRLQELDRRLPKYVT